MENKEIKVCVRFNQKLIEQTEQLKEKFNLVPRENKPWWYFDFNNNSKVIRALIILTSAMSQEEINELFKKNKSELQNV